MELGSTRGATLRRRSAALVLATVLLSSAVGCDSTDAEPAAAPASARAGSDLHDRAVQVVARRERALRDGDREAFLATVDRADRGFYDRQARWFDNLRDLPLDRVRLRPGDMDRLIRMPKEGAVQLPVDFTMRIRGYESTASTSWFGYTFTQRDGHLLLTGDGFEGLAFTTTNPWDNARIRVRRSPHVLCIFDDRTASQATQVMPQIEAALDAVDAQVPHWRGRVVAYDVSDTKAIDHMSAMSVRDTAGVAFPVPVAPRSRKVAAMRFAVNPENLGTGLAQGVLFRHELTHVALGTVDDHSPTWLVEGAAELVGWSALPADIMRRGLATVPGQSGLALTSGRDFYQIRPKAHYAAAWAVCEYVAATRGTETLWRLMRTFTRERDDIVSDADAAAVVRRELGVAPSRLVADALAWIAAG